MVTWLITVKRDIVPASVRIDAPAEVRDRVAIHVVGRPAVILQPVVHKLGIQAALDPADKAIAHLEPNLVLNVTTIRKDHDIAGLKDDRAIGAALVRERMDEPTAPTVVPPGRFRKA